MSLTRMRVWRSFFTHIISSPLPAAENLLQRRSQSLEPLNVPSAYASGSSFLAAFLENVLSSLIAMPSHRFRGPARLPEQNFGVSGNEEIRHGTDFLIPLLAIERAGAVVEV